MSSQICLIGGDANLKSSFFSWSTGDVCDYLFLEQVFAQVMRYLQILRRFNSGRVTGSLSACLQETGCASIWDPACW